MAGDAAISFQRSGERAAARYVSAAAVYEEALEHGRWIGLYWSAIGQAHRENVVARLPDLDSLRRPIHAFELEIDGQCLHNRWNWARLRRPGEAPGTNRGRGRAAPPDPPGHGQGRDAPGRHADARALSGDHQHRQLAAAAQVAPWSGVLWNTNTERPATTERQPRVRGAGPLQVHVGLLCQLEEWGHEGNFVWQPLPQENFASSARRAAVWGSPYYILRNEATGEMFFLGLAWGGNSIAEFAYRHDALLSFRIGPLAPAPLRLIAPGETVTPEVHLGPVHGVRPGGRLWHRHMRASVIRRAPRVRRCTPWPAA